MDRSGEFSSVTNSALALRAIEATQKKNHETNDTGQKLGRRNIRRSRRIALPYLTAIRALVGFAALLPFSLFAQQGTGLLFER
jgi:hypothetical protein